VPERAALDAAVPIPFATTNVAANQSPKRSAFYATGDHTFRKPNDAAD
jgi:fermentation-respiration switch protein FrsA (DUF1100 family)